MLNKKNKGFFNLFKTEGEIVEVEVGKKATSKSKMILLFKLV